jgi:hypothetical protein
MSATHLQNKRIVVLYRAFLIVCGGTMRQFMEYSALAGTGWLSSNVLVIIAWSWLHSRKRRWMSDNGARFRLFKLHNGPTNLRVVSPHRLSGSVTKLGPVRMPVIRAS